MRRTMVLHWMVLVVLCTHSVWTQQLDDCPTNWFEYSGSCYNFILYSTMTYQEAQIYCLQDHTTLLSINTAGEHGFIQNWLTRHDGARQEWFTSGYRTTSGQLIWESDGSDITTDFFPTTEAKNQVYKDPMTNIAYNQIVYKYIASLGEYRWAWSRVMKVGPFVCEISKQDTWKLYQQRRDFTYGSTIKDPNMIEMGPNITFLSKDMVFFEIQGRPTPVVLDCQATGNPRPDYRWYKLGANRQDMIEITGQLSSRYTVTNGRLTIDNPDKVLDVTEYTCVAENKFGSVESNPIRVSYGYVDEFSNIPQSPIVATLYMGKEISCEPPGYSPALYYTWYKRDVFNFVRPELNAQYFLSRNGRFYISEVQAVDQDTYFCGVFMAAASGQVLAGTQVPSRNSLGIEVKVQGENPNTYGPDIQDRFPQYFPSVPLVGDTVFIECLAYGRLPLHYSWVREDGPLHPGAYLSDHNRVLTIPNARLEDTGIYTCVVQGDRNSANKTAHLSLKAKPSFPYPLQNQHVDVGSKLVWPCSAIGVPKPMYSWYKNGKLLKSDPAIGLTVNRNILTIDKVDGETHNGMYQCEATNSYGTGRTSAQLRVLSFAPTFANRPVMSSKQAAEGGNVTISCYPEGAPRPQITWEKNGGQVGKVLPNGDLELSFLKFGDAGTYTCVATNDLGEARSSCDLSVQGSAIFTELPVDIEVEINETASIPCKASFDRSKTDIIYSWKFNNHVIDFFGLGDDREYYSMPFAKDLDSGMLYVIGAEFKHEGEYTCMVTTVTGSITASGYLTVRGPPGEPGGVHARQRTSEDLLYSSIELWWQQGEIHGYDVTKYAIQYQSVYENEWKLLVENVPDHDVHIDEYPDWRGYLITEGLSPGSAYRFRVAAGSSQIGWGPWSGGPYVYYNIAEAPPIYPPSNVGGGGGSVGELNIKWDPLPRTLWGAHDVWYQVYFRRQEEGKDGKWETSGEIRQTYLHDVVGQQLYYTPYEVKVQAINPKGRGPNSTVVIVYSAEDMPSNIAPTFVQANAVNSTAGIVEWVPVPNTREGAKGQVFAYQVNYWLEDTRCIGTNEDTAMFHRFYGQVSEGMLVGLDPTADYCVNLQFLNNAGLGSKTDNYYLGMNDFAPSLYPEYVTVMSNGNESVRLIWRGISTLFQEDPLRGYKAWWWDIRNDIRSATETVFGRTTTGVLHGVEKDVIYKVRVMGYSTGGDGKKSQDVFFTLGGMVPFDPATTVIMNSAPAVCLFSWISLSLTAITTILVSSIV